MSEESGGVGKEFEGVHTKLYLYYYVLNYIMLICVFMSFVRDFIFFNISK